MKYLYSSLVSDSATRAFACVCLCVLRWAWFGLRHSRHVHNFFILTNLGFGIRDNGLYAKIASDIIHSLCLYNGSKHSLDTSATSQQPMWMLCVFMPWILWAQLLCRYNCYLYSVSILYDKQACNELHRQRATSSTTADRWIEIIVVFYCRISYILKYSTCACASCTVCAPHKRLGLLFEMENVISRRIYVRKVKTPDLTLSCKSVRCFVWFLLSLSPSLAPSPSFSRPFRFFFLSLVFFFVYLFCDWVSFARMCARNVQHSWYLFVFWLALLSICFFFFFVCFFVLWFRVSAQFSHYTCLLFGILNSVLCVRCHLHVNRDIRRVSMVFLTSFSCCRLLSVWKCVNFNWRSYLLLAR